MSVQVHLIKFHSLPQYFGTYNEKSKGMYKTKIVYFNSKRNARKCARQMNRFYKKHGRIPTLKNMNDTKISDCGGLCENFIVYSMDKDNVDFVCAMSNIGTMACDIDDNRELVVEDELHIELCADIHREYLESLM